MPTVSVSRRCRTFPTLVISLSFPSLSTSSSSPPSQTFLTGFPLVIVLPTRRSVLSLFSCLSVSLPPVFKCSVLPLCRTIPATVFSKQWSRRHIHYIRHRKRSFSALTLLLPWLIDDDDAFTKTSKNKPKITHNKLASKIRNASATQSVAKFHFHQGKKTARLLNPEREKI